MGLLPQARRCGEARLGEARLDAGKGPPEATDPSNAVGGYEAVGTMFHASSFTPTTASSCHPRSSTLPDLHSSLSVDEVKTKAAKPTSHRYAF